MQNKQSNEPALLRGVIHGMTKRRASYETVFTATDRRNMERTALVAALAGLNDIALNLSNSAQFTDTVADLVTFDLNGESVRAWVWLSVFENGDEVEVVAERAESGWIGYAIKRCKDGVLSVHPHCERGSKALLRFYLKSSVLFWSVCALAMTILILTSLPHDTFLERKALIFQVFATVWCVAEGTAILIALRICRKFKRQLPMANKIFETFGWKNPPDIDLPKVSKKLRKPDDTWRMGKLIFRYGES